MPDEVVDAKTSVEQHPVAVYVFLLLSGNALHLLQGHQCMFRPLTLFQSIEVSVFPAEVVDAKTSLTTTNNKTDIQTDRQTCMHACMHVCIHAYMHTCIHAYMHTCIHAYRHTDKQTDRQTDLQGLLCLVIGLTGPEASPASCLRAGPARTGTFFLHDIHVGLTSALKVSHHLWVCLRPCARVRCLWSRCP